MTDAPVSEVRGNPADSQASRPVQAPVRDTRRATRDGKNGAITAGLLSGTTKSERRDLLVSMGAVAIMVSVVNVVDVMTVHHTRPAVSLAFLGVCGFSSALTFTVFSSLAFMALRLAPLQGGLLSRILLVHSTAALLFVSLHIGGFVAIREIVAAATETPYRFGPLPSELFYELGKDTFAYPGILVIFWATPRILAHRTQSVTRPRTYDIQDGARLIRVSMNDILAVRSAANYVEFVLRDGRRPMMRKPLSTLESELATDGFVRTHRSWLVNAMQVTGLNPEGSGDYAVEIGSVTVPLSRRFPEALARLRAG